jgi:hypothetical protein
MLFPWMLLGLAGLGIPVVIHLIQRQRLKPEPLSTLAFLDQEDIANSFAPTPRDVLQLLLRLAVLGLLVLLMTRLVVSRGDAGPRTMAIVLDQSMSMQRKTESGECLFDRSKKQILDLIETMGPDDRMSLTLVGDQVAVETGYLRERSELRRIAERFEGSSAGSKALLPALRNCARQLMSRHEVSSSVLVFSDHRRRSFASSIEEGGRGGSDNPTLAFRDCLDHSQIRIYLVDERLPEGPNLAIERASFSPTRTAVGSSSRMTAVIRNGSSQEQTTTVQIVEGDQVGERRSLTLDPFETASLDLVHRFEQPKDRPCRVEIEDDVLPSDNRFFVPMRMKEWQQILLVAPGSPRGEDEGRPAGLRGVDLLTYALNPAEALGLGGGASLRVKRIAPTVLEREALPVYSTLIFYGGGEVSEQSAKDLAAYLDNGGIVWLVPERDLSPAKWNRNFGAILKGFSIGALRQADPPQLISPEEGGLAHPLLLPLLREEWGNSRDLSFSEYYGVEAGGSAQAALRARNGDWLAAVVRHGRGAVVVQLFSGELEASSLPRTAAFVPFVQRIAVDFAGAAAAERPDVLRVGEILDLSVPEFRRLSGELRVSGPETRSFSLGGPEGDQVRLEGLRKAGAYEVSHPQKKTGRERWVGVNAVLEGSDLTPLGEEDQARVLGLRNVQRIPYKALVAQISRRHEIKGILALLLTLAFVAEALAGAWQSRRGARRDELPRGAA